MVSTPTSLSSSGLNSALLMDPGRVMSTVMTHGLRVHVPQAGTCPRHLFSHGVLANHPWKEALLCPLTDEYTEA